MKYLPDPGLGVWSMSAVWAARSIVTDGMGWDIFSKLNCLRSKQDLMGSAPNYRHGRSLSLRMSKHWIFRPGLERVGRQQSAFVRKCDMPTLPAATHGQHENGKGSGVFRKWRASPSTVSADTGDRDAMRDPNLIANNVCYSTKADKVGLWPTVCPLLTQSGHRLRAPRVRVRVTRRGPAQRPAIRLSPLPRAARLCQAVSSVWIVGVRVK